MVPRVETAQPNLYLIGFMGVGKSAVGRQVARAARLRFIDSDKEIELASGMAIKEIFAREGELGFRAREREFLERGHPDHGCVVACGGGILVPPGMRELLLQKGVVVCLFASAGTILKRTGGNDRRPLLNVSDPEARVRQLLAERLPLYQSTGTGISTENRSVTEVVQHILRVYEFESRQGKGKGL